MDQKTIPLDKPITRGKEKLTKLTIRKPGSGELRGIQMALIKMEDADTTIKLLQRCTAEGLTGAEASSLEFSDLVQCSEVFAAFSKAGRHQGTS